MHARHLQKYSCLDLAACQRRVCYAHKSCDDDPLLCMVETIFGYEENTEINGKNGINEFLSAMVAVRLLEPHLPKTQLAQIALCIAATIPFRNKDNGESNPPYMEKLYNNMKVARERFGSTLLQSHADDDEFWIQTVQMATRLANSGTYTQISWRMRQDIDTFTLTLTPIAPFTTLLFCILLRLLITREQKRYW